MGDRCGHRHEARVALKCRLHRLQCFPSSFAIAYVNAGTDIAAKLALKHEIWPPNFPHPTVDAVVPTQSVFNAEFFAAVECRAPSRQTQREIVRVYAFSPSVPEFLVDPAPGEFQPMPIEPIAQFSWT